VQKLGRIILSALGGLLLLALVVLLGMNLYVQSQGTQVRIKQALRRHLGTDLRIGQISVTPWGGLKLSGITIPQQDQRNPADFLNARSFTLRFRFLSLFSRRLVITQVTLTGPRVVWQQNEQGKWRLPTAENEARPQRELDLGETELPAFSPSAELLPSATPVVGPTIAASPPTKGENGGFATEIRHINLRGGNFRFLDRSGKLVAGFENVGLRSLMRGPSTLRGRATIDKISVRDRVFLQRLVTPLHYEAGALEFSQIAARIADGEISGHFSIDPQKEDSPFSVETKFHDVQADRLITDAGGSAGILQGKLEGSFQANGKTADAESLAGGGEILLRDGQVKQYPLLVALGQMLQIDELMQLRLEQASAKYQVRPGLVTVDQLDLRSDDIHLSATGTISFSGKLHLDSRLSIDDKVRDRLFKPIRANFQASNEPGFYGIDFQVTGTLDRPKTNLLEKAVGSGLKDFLNTILRGKSERPKKGKAAAAEEMSSPGPAQPEATVAPSP